MIGDFRRAVRSARTAESEPTSWAVETGPFPRPSANRAWSDRCQRDARARHLRRAGGFGSMPQHGRDQVTRWTRASRHWPPRSATSPPPRPAHVVLEHDVIVGDASRSGSPAYPTTQALRLVVLSSGFRPTQINVDRPCTPTTAHPSRSAARPDGSWYRPRVRADHREHSRRPFASARVPVLPRRTASNRHASPSGDMRQGAI